MRINFRTRHRADVEFGLVYGGIAVLALAALRVLPIAHLLPGCAFMKTAAIPCPTCGATRSATLLMHGELFASLCMNPIAAIVFVSAPIVFLYSLVSLLLRFPRADVTFSAQEHLRIRVAIALLVLANWAYLICTLPRSS